MIFPFFTHFSLFSSFFRLFFAFLRFCLLFSSSPQQHFTAKMGNFTPTPSAPTPCKTSRSSQNPFGASLNMNSGVFRFRVFLGYARNKTRSKETLVSRSASVRVCRSKLVHSHAHARSPTTPTLHPQLEQSATWHCMPACLRACSFSSSHVGF